MAASNHDDVLAQLRAGGLFVDRLEVGTSRPVRCKVEDGGREKRGWYILHELTTDRGDLLIVGSFGVWRGNENHATKVELRKTELSREQREALHKRLREDRRRADRDRKREAAQAAAKAESIWRRLLPDGESEYLARKAVSPHGLRFTKNGTAVVPLLDTSGRLHGLQFLRTPAAAKESRRPAKEFWPAGLVKKGHFHLIGSPTWIVLEAEGYATAATLHAATGLPVAVAFDAGNLAAVADALRKRYKLAKILLCADDDILGHCAHVDNGKRCGARVVLPLHGETCPSCGNPHGYTNAGASAASSAAMAVDGAWLKPTFPDPDARHAAFLERGTKLTDFNDLQHADALHAVRIQVEAQLSALRWSPPGPRASHPSIGEGGDERLRPIQYLDELLERYALVYAGGGAVFDRQEHCLLPLNDMKNACIDSALHAAWMKHHDRDIVRSREVGFDPAETDQNISCNLWGGWPTAPRAGSCERLLDLLRYMCQGEHNANELFEWVLRWIAYPIQHPGAKMKSTVVIHGPQGTGKNLFFEAVMAIYGPYGRILDQDALIDKHNDWASRKLFLIADEVVAQAHRFEHKNKLKVLISGTTIRINPKHIASYEEVNHVNLVFLSNETMPVVLEEDDRRHCVLWTPPKREAAYYKAVLAEIEAGGVAALHDYLLQVDLAGFDPGTHPPDTAAKDELISLAQDSPVEFVDAILTGDALGLKDSPGLTTDWYAAYKLWCSMMGVRPAPMRRFVNALERKRGLRSERKRYVDMATADEFGVGPPPVVGPHATILWSRSAPEGDSETIWLGECIRKFRCQVDDLRGGVR